MPRFHDDVCKMKTVLKYVKHVVCFTGSVCTLCASPAAKAALIMQKQEVTQTFPCPQYSVFIFNLLFLLIKSITEQNKQHLYCHQNRIKNNLMHTLNPTLEKLFLLYKIVTFYFLTKKYLLHFVASINQLSIIT